MRITHVSGGCDTGLYLVDVLLETPQEQSLDWNGLWRVAGPMLEARGINLGDVLDIFPHTLNEAGERTPWPK